jgi:dienelactone hydrolase
MNPSDYPRAYSPSHLHHRLMHEVRPKLTYTDGPVDQWQAQLRQRLIQQLGYDLLPADKTPRNICTLWRKAHELGTIEKIVFTSEEGCDVPCYFCLPHAAKDRPVPVFICLQGHSTGMHNSIAVALEDEDRPIVVEGDRDFALGCMKRGIAALCIEQRSFGERREKLQSRVSPHMCHDAAMHALMLGRTLAAERIHDVAVGIEYLRTRPEVDLTELGLMGNSGGGTITLYAAILPEVKLAMPSCSFCTYKASIMSIYHCADNYIPGLLQWAEAGDIAGLYAPRPLVIVAGRDDEIFPLPQVYEAYEQVKRIYIAAHAADNCRLIIGDGGHRFYAEPAWQAMKPFMKG